MAHNFLSQRQLKNFYQNRKKLNDQIGQLLGPDIHLHDISQQQIPKSTQITSKRKPQIPITNLPPANKRKSDKYQAFFTSYENEEKTDRLYRQNMQLQKKMIVIKDQNQAFKHKASLWQRLKQFILSQVNKQLRFKSIKYCSSDGSMLDQFIKLISQIIEKSRQSGKNSKGNQKDHTTCRQLQEQIKNKYEQQNRKVSKLLVQVQALKTQNLALKQKQNAFQQQRKAKITQIQSGIQQKFQQIQKDLQQKTKQNNQLLKKISYLQSTIFQLKNDRSPLYKKDKTFSTNVQSTYDRSQLDNYIKLTRGKDQQINRLRKQSLATSAELKNLQLRNQKMKKVVKLAQTLNNQFLQKIQQSIKKNQTFNQQVSSQYNLRGFDKGLSTQQEFHMVNKRFKIVKSRSVDKQRFAFGTAGTT